MGNEEKAKEFVGYGLPATGTIRWVGEYPKFVHFPLLFSITSLFFYKSKLILQCHIFR
jgi:hypothetical protein